MDSVKRMMKQQIGAVEEKVEGQKKILEKIMGKIEEDQKRLHEKMGKIEALLLHQAGLGSPTESGVAHLWRFRPSGGPRDSSGGCFLQVPCQSQWRISTLVVDQSRNSLYSFKQLLPFVSFINLSPALMPSSLAPPVL